MVHLSDLDWKRPGEQVIEEYKKGDKVKAQVLDVDVEKERISLGIKQLADDGVAAGARGGRRAQEGRRRHLRGHGGEGRRHRREDRQHRSLRLHQALRLARDRSEQRPDRFAVGQKVDARVIQFDRRAHKASVSIKALEVAEEKEAIAQYGSSDSGATLGDILGTALKRKGEEDEKGDTKE
jgi:small subunit ribosomal protein S1